MKKKIFLWFIVWRLLLFIPILLGAYFLPYRMGYPYTSPTFFIPKESFISNILLSPWANFDGVHYLLIAANGYDVNAGFFPLFPLLIHVFSFPFGITLGITTQIYFVGFFLANIFFFLSLLVFFALIKIDYKKNIAEKSLLFLLVFPTSFFFASIYSESLFLLLSLLAFYFARKKMWLLAAVAAILLTSTRLVGIAILPALLYEFYLQEMRVGKRVITIVKSLLFFVIPTGLISYMAYNYFTWGNALYFITAQGKFDNNRSVTSVVLLPQTMYRYIKILLDFFPSQFEWWIALFEFLIFIFVSILLFYAWRKKVRFSYLLFSVICLVIPASTGTLTGLPRYALVLFPVFIALSLIKNKVVIISYTATSILLSILLLLYFSRGYFVG